MTHFNLAQDSWIFHRSHYCLGQQACWGCVSFLGRQFKSPRQLKIEGERYIGLILDGETPHSEIGDAQFIW
jgi:hypothetical protein